MEPLRVISLRIPEQKVLEDGTVFPLVLAPAPGQRDGAVNTRALERWIAGNRPFLAESLLRHGAILFRGFGLSSPQDFCTTVEATGMGNIPYIGGAAVRHNIVKDRVYTTNESPPQEPIPFHHEMAQTPNPPTHIFFFCDVEPPKGGETPIILSHRVYDNMRKNFPEFTKKVEKIGVKYRRVMPDQDDESSAIGRSWRSTFLTQDKSEAEERMRDIGTTWTWRVHQINLYLSTRSLIIYYPFISLPRTTVMWRPSPRPYLLSASTNVLAKRPFSTVWLLPTLGGSIVETTLLRR